MKFVKTFFIVFWVNLKRGLRISHRAGSRAAAASKMERFMIIVNGLQLLTIITKRSILDVAAALDPPLSQLFNGVLWKNCCEKFWKFSETAMMEFVYGNTKDEQFKTLLKHTSKFDQTELCSRCFWEKFFSDQLVFRQPVVACLWCFILTDLIFTLDFRIYVTTVKDCVGNVVWLWQN